jgi:ribonuclease P protein subunit RPR2
MAKGKTAGSVQNRPIYSRISYLYQAATYLSSTSGSHAIQPEIQQTEHHQAQGEKQSYDAACHVKQAVSRRLLTEMKATSLKAQIRMSTSMKHTICKHCDTLLVEGDTSTSYVENQSKGGRKPWADVLVIKCNTCGGPKRFPLHAPRQNRREKREMAAVKEEREVMLGG